MKGSLYVALDYFKNEPNYRFYNISGDSKYSLYLNICFFDNLIDCLYFDGNLKKELCKAIEDDKSSLNDCLKKLLNYYNFNKSSNNLIETIDTVYIYGNIDEIVEFINNNPILEDKKVVIDNFFSFRNDDLYLLLSELSDYSNIYINLKGNSNAVNIEDIIKTVDIIDNMIQHCEQCETPDFHSLTFTLYHVQTVPEYFSPLENKRILLQKYKEQLANYIRVEVIEKFLEMSLDEQVDKCLCVSFLFSMINEIDSYEEWMPTKQAIQNQDHVDSLKQIIQEQKQIIELKDQQLENEKHKSHPSINQPKNNILEQ